MRNLPRRSVLLVCLPVSIVFCSISGSALQRDSYAGVWTGSYTAANGNKGSLTYLLSKDQKGQWGGTVKFSNDGGEQSADLKSVRIASGKFSAKIETPDGKSIVAIEGTFRGNRLDGTYVVSNKESGQKVDGGSWTTEKSTASKARP
ncbi:MAG TPA: hypothetical protein VLM38_21345 [Blastocatellia bacterium]|nr:hypothetical protein [Blastocatellia bacterium]